MLNLLLVSWLRNYSLFPSSINSSSLRIVISGNRPDPSTFDQWPERIKFDGEFSREYSSSELERIAMFSDNYTRYSLWKGEGQLPEKEKQIIQELIDKAHHLGKTVRFWNAPDNLNSWRTLIEMGVDYINTDHIEELASFLKTVILKNSL